jgi:hypothetical protein
MKYGDLSSVVQLGVGLHLGTALLQIYGELGVQPVARTFARLRHLIGDGFADSKKQLNDQLDQLESEFQIFKIQLFNEYKRYVIINSWIAVTLAIVLVIIAYRTDTTISVELSVFAIALSVLPAPITLGVLWFDAARAIKPIQGKASMLESVALQAGRDD